MPATKIIGDFPFLVPHGAPDPYQNRVTVPLTIARRWYTNVAVWDVLITLPSAIVSAHHADGSSETLDVELFERASKLAPQRLVDGARVLSEAQLAAPCGVAYGLGGATSALANYMGVGGVTPYYTAGSTFELFVPSRGGTFYPAMIRHPTRDEYYPRLRFTAEFYAEAGGVSFSVLTSNELNGSYYPSPYANPDYYRFVDANVTIDGYSVPALTLQTWNGGGVDGSATLTVSEPVSIRITPASLAGYWAQARPDGVPMIDVNTGMPAINPANGNLFTPEEIVAAPIL